MKYEYKSIINELRRIYRNVNFDIIEEQDSIQLLCDNKELCDDIIYLDRVCDLVEKFLDEEDKNKFAVLYDYLNEISVWCFNDISYEMKWIIIDKQI